MHTLLLIFCSLWAASLFGQSTISEDCRKTMDVKVVLDYKKQPELPATESDTGKVATTNSWRFSTITLKAVDSTYKITQFKIAGTYDDGDIVEVPNSGPLFKSSALQLINELGKGKPLYIFCIYARDRKGKEWVLEPVVHVF